MSEPIRVYLIDDQAMIRAGLRSFLNQSENIEVVGDSGDPRSAVDHVAELRAEVCLLDITMPGLSGLDTIPLLRRATPRTKILMVTHHEGEAFVERALASGADGYLSKDSDPGELAIAIEAVHRGDPFVSPKVSAALLARARRGESGSNASLSRIDALTPREREVFQLLAIGHSNKEVARDLGMSLGTAKKHRENLQRKLDCHSSAELARLAIREGLLES